jgi:hypothetical protein
VSELDERVVVGGVASLSGRYALQGRLAAAGVQQAVADVRSAGGLRIAGRRVVPELLLLDDESTRLGVRRGLDTLVDADLLIGPYGSDLVRDAAAWAAQQRRALWNHGGNADGVEGLSGVVSVASPASRSSRRWRGIGPRHGYSSRWAEAGSGSTWLGARRKLRGSWACPSSVA